MMHVMISLASSLNMRPRQASTWFPDLAVCKRQVPTEKVEVEKVLR